ncbi:MAG: beta-L-arabinofuranosidase domain-containing protein [Acidobacteriota bacterium]
MSQDRPTLTRRELLRTAGTAVAFVVTSPLVELAVGDGGALAAQALPMGFRAVAGPDRVVMRHGRTYLNAWVGYGEMPRRTRARGGASQQASPSQPVGPAPTVTWSQVSGPGTITFADPKAPVTTAAFSAPGVYVVQVVTDNGTEKATSALTVTVELPPPAAALSPVATRVHSVTDPFWASRTKALITSWIPHCIDQINRTDIPAGRGDGGIDNFVEAGKALRGESYAAHKGYVFSNAWVHQTVESICLALMVDPRGDQEIIAAQAKLRATLEDWIPKILAAQHPDGYLQTAFTLRNAPRDMPPPAAGRGPWTERWSAAARGNHEGYVAGYFIESAINHYLMTEGRDLRLYDAAKRLADCWADHIGPSPKQEWFDGHQEMEQALVRFGRFVNEIEKKPGQAPGPGDRYIALAKFLLDCRRDGTEYDQSHLPVRQQYEAVGHAVRAVYTYSGMADVAIETHDVDYQSAVKSIWDNLVHRKYYVTGGVGSGESSEGFGPDYSLRNNAYCEACSSCGEIFFQWKMHLAYHDATFADLYEQTLYNALYGSMDLAGKNFYYTNPLDANVQRYGWHNCPCCVGNIARTMLMLPTWTYSKSADGVFVNLFVGGRVGLGEVGGTDVEMVQETTYPWNGTVTLTVNPKEPKAFAVRIRAPRRDVSSLYRATPGGDGITRITLNGTAVKPVVVRGYVEIVRRWKAGDTIEVVLPLPIQRVYGSDRIVAGGNRPSPVKDRVALRRGPLVYNIENVDQDTDSVLPPAAPLVHEWRRDLLGGVTVITSTFANGAPMLAVPNFARYNRHPPAPPPPPPAAPGSPPPRRPAPPPPESIVWIREK